MMECPQAPNLLSFRRARASRDNLAQEAEIMDAWMQALEDHDIKDVAKVDEDIETEDE